ncbi:MAG: sigma 54-interacting transcriptional regulator [Candidatus Acidiferrales bacterium]
MGTDYDDRWMKMHNDYLNASQPTGELIPDRILFGRSRAMEEVRQAVQSVSDAPVPILLQGEKGTGKEVIGREIHRRSSWQSGLFVKVSGAEMPRSISRNQATGSGEALSSLWKNPNSSQSGSAGTLFIDEVSELRPDVQAKLLEFFQEGSLDPENGGTNDPIHPRVICATQRNLEEEVAASNFRLDLFYRINVITVQLPRLRDRKEDIPELADYFFDVSCRKQNRRCPGISTDLLERFCEYEWPGNIRELENCVSTYVNLDGNGKATEALLAKRAKPARNRIADRRPNPVPLRAYTRKLVLEAERDMILKVLSEQRWNRRETARVLQVSYQTLLHKLKQNGLDKKRRPATGSVTVQVPEGRLP